MDQRYYPKIQGLLLSVHQRLMRNKKYKGRIQIIIYDLGMSVRQLKVLKRGCQCELRRFHFEDLPPHIRDPRTYAFKPIIIQKLLMEFGFVWWVDSSVRFTTSDVDVAIDYAREHSMLFSVSLSPRELYNVAQQTDIRTFQFFKEDTCKFRPFAETWATTALFHFDSVTKAVVNAWAVCALNRDCIAPIGSKKKLFCDESDRSDGRCHRFDQSAFSIITRRVYHEQNMYPINKKLSDIWVIKRDDFVDYLEVCKPLKICL